MAWIAACAPGGMPLVPETDWPELYGTEAERITLHDLDGVDLSEVPLSPALEAPPVHQQLVIQRLVFDRDSPRLRLTMKMPEKDGVDPEQGDLWRANGFGIGRIRRERLGLFMANLPQPLAADVYRVHNASTYAPLTLISRTAAGERVHLAGTGDDERIIEPGIGEYRMLFKLAPPDEGEQSPLRLTMLPHHKRSGRTLLPRSGEQRMFHGTAFDDLRMEQPIEPGVIWVIWADLPPLPEQDEEDDLAAAANAGEPADSVAGPGDEHLTLGEAMLSGHRRGRAVQLVILLGIL